MVVFIVIIKNVIFIVLYKLIVTQFTKEIAESIVGHTVGRIVVGARDATPGNIRDGFIGCVKVCISIYTVSKKTTMTFYAITTMDINRF